MTQPGKWWPPICTPAFKVSLKVYNFECPIKGKFYRPLAYFALKSRYSLARSCAIIGKTSSAIWNNHMVEWNVLLVEHTLHQPLERTNTSIHVQGYIRWLCSQLIRQWLANSQGPLLANRMNSTRGDMTTRDEVLEILKSKLTLVISVHVVT